MERLKSMKNCLMSQAESQMGNLQSVDAQELGEVIDMIKDLEEAIYYCTIVDAMEKKQPREEENVYYYTETPAGQPPVKMPYSERNIPTDWPMRDDREGRSPKYRRMYIESKEMHQNMDKKMQDLEKYLHELSNDITTMIEDASPDEKQILQRKLNILASKIDV